MVFLLKLSQRFQRQFAMVTGCTLASYVSRRKMTIATIYLTQTEASMRMAAT